MLEFLVAQQVRNPAFSLLWLRSLPWCGFDPCPWELPYSVAVAIKKKKKKHPWAIIETIDKYDYKWFNKYQYVNKHKKVEQIKNSYKTQSERDHLFT